MVPLSGGKGWAGLVDSIFVGFGLLMSRPHELSQHKDLVLPHGHASNGSLDLISDS